MRLSDIIVVVVVLALILALAAMLPMLAFMGVIICGIFGALL